ncbi:hypothetical protein [Xanthovirga aplysinae]|uniref:hypothetical protein n=1 Tax=Xanthovirga aplysinae TaxID=2529853 RepID=UPI0012BBF7D5|nr:hypothetical protein [Xanthovirga aplysinae]MTI33156.1 hypothetical protein [Xanthovirga aplysinae]
MSIAIEDVIAGLDQAKNLLSVPATVKNVDEANATCDVDLLQKVYVYTDKGETKLTLDDKVEDEGKEEITSLSGVRLNGIYNTGIYTTADPQGSILLPKANSKVLVSILNMENSYVNVLGDTEKAAFNFEKIGLNGNSFGGLVIAGNLVSRLNELERAFNAFLEDYRAHNHIESTGMVTMGLVGEPPENIEETELNFLENTNITHGR